MRRLLERTPRRRLGIRLALAALATAGLIAVTSPDRGTRGGGISVLLAAGALEHQNSRDGSAILSAGSVWPGWSGQGDVTIKNTGSAGSWLRLTEASVDDLPSPGGGLLSQRMQLVVEDVTDAGFPVPVYSGTLGDVGVRWLGRMEPGEARAYRFRTTMPSQADDNDYQTAAVSVRFDWAVSNTDPDDPNAVDPPPSTEEPPDEPAPSDTPSDDTPEQPAAEPDIQLVPDGPPVVEVKRARLNVKLAVPATQRPLKRRRFTVFVRCSRACRARTRVKMKFRHRKRVKRMRSARVSRALSAGTRTRIRLRIGKRAARKALQTLRRGHPVRATVTLVARPPGGPKTRAKQKIRLVPVKGSR